MKARFKDLFVLVLTITPIPSSSFTPSVTSSLTVIDPQRLPRKVVVREATGAAMDELSLDEGKATIPNEIFNLVKSIIGAGVLSLPAGVAAYGNAPSALLPAICLIVVMGSISAYTFTLLARICQQTGATSYADAWIKTNSRHAWLIAASSFLDCFAGNLTYSMVLADTFRDLLSTIGIVTTRTIALLGLTSTVLLPLCLVKNLSSLAPFSLVGIVGMAYTTIVIAIRYMGGMYKTGSLVGPVSPSFGSVGAIGAMSLKSLLLVCMLSTAYIAHFNAPKFYKELKNNTIERFNIVTVSSFGISMAVYAIITTMGFLTFGGATSGMILNNYSTQDLLLSGSRFAVATSLVCSYPLLFVGTRDGILDLCQIRNPTVALQNKLSVALLCVLTALAWRVKDLTFVASMSGAVFGTSLIFIFPTLMFRSLIERKGSSATKRQRAEAKVAGVITAFGLAIGGVGAKMALETLH